MLEDARREVAAGSEKEGWVSEVGFVFLVQRMDGMEQGLRQEIKVEIGGLRQEMKQEIGGLRQEIKVEIGGLRQEMKQEIGGLRQEMKEEMGGLRQDHLGLRQEMKEEMGGLRQELGNLRFWAISGVISVLVATASVVATLWLR